MYVQRSRFFMNVLLTESVSVSHRSLIEFLTVAGNKNPPRVRDGQFVSIQGIRKYLATLTRYFNFTFKAPKAQYGHKNAEKKI